MKPHQPPARFTSPLGLLLLLLLLVSGLGVEALGAPKRIRINLGTLAPRGSLYHQTLQKMGEQWSAASGGTIHLVIYPDGSQGGESDMVRLMRVGTLQAGLLTAVGISDIEPDVGALANLPMMFRTLEEFGFVNDRLRPRIEARLAEKGFVLLYLADAGWVHFFSKEPMIRPDDLKQMKVFAWAGNVQQVAIMEKAGFKPVPLETTEILTGLQTGLFSALSTPPMFALASQIDIRAPHMLELNWAPLVGGALIKKATWESIAPDVRAKLLQAAAQAGATLQTSSRRDNDQTVAAMQKRGLTVHKVDAALEDVWRKAAETVYPDLRGTLVPADLFDEVVRLLKEYREQTRRAAR